MADADYTYRPRTEEQRARMREAQFRRLGHRPGCSRVYGFDVPFEHAPEVRRRAQEIIRVAGRDAMIATMARAAEVGWHEMPDRFKPSEGVSGAYFDQTLLLPHVVRG